MIPTYYPALEQGSTSLQSLGTDSVLCYAVAMGPRRALLGTLSYKAGDFFATSSTEETCLYPLELCMALIEPVCYPPTPY
eukprot:3941142-Rhodomonas_salina.2